MTSTEARRARIAHLQRMDAAAPGFWKARGEEAAEVAAKAAAPDPHKAHKRLQTDVLMATCRECGVKRIRWMVERSPTGYLRATGERFAKQYGIEVNLNARTKDGVMRAPKPIHPEPPRQRPDTSGRPSLY